MILCCVWSLEPQQSFGHQEVIYQCYLGVRGVGEEQGHVDPEKDVSTEEGRVKREKKDSQ